jgi:hypothetical protein
VVARDGIEPPTPAFSGPRSTTELPGLSAETSVAISCADSGDAGNKAGTSSSSALQQAQVYQFELPGPNPRRARKRRPKSRLHPGGFPIRPVWCDNLPVGNFRQNKALTEGETSSMKRLFVYLSVLAFAATISAQQSQPMSGQMPMGGEHHMAHHGAPLSPPATATVTINGKTISINYSSPRVKGREGHIFTPDGLIQKTHKSYPIWRAGANAATTLHTDADLTIGHLQVPAGTYTLFVDIANPDQWSLVVSKDTGEWGLAYKPNMDLGRTRMHMSKPSSMVEDLTYTLKDDGGNKGTLTLAWEDKEASVHFTVH